MNEYKGLCFVEKIIILIVWEVSMLKVSFYDNVDDSLLKFAVIVSKSQGKWVFCKHKERSTYECPGGHRETGEDILSTAKRELYEETGATEYLLKKICVYSVFGNDGVIKNSTETFGMLYFADIIKFEGLPGFEIEKIELFEKLPDNWTYPEIQPILMEKVLSVTNQREFKIKI
jgi:8-oxo-dGTP diphosphatase